MSGQSKNDSVRGGEWRFSGALGAAVLIVGLLGGCSSVPDYANPAAWYRGVFGEKKAEAPSAARVPAPGASQPYPNLGTVPARPRDVSSAQERTNIQQGLLADRANAQYTDETLAPGGAPRPSAPASTAVPSPVTAPPPARAVIAPPPVAPPPVPAATAVPTPALAPAAASQAPVAPSRSAATIGGATTTTQTAPIPAAPPAYAAPAGSLPPTTAQTQTGMSRAQALVQALKADAPPATSRPLPAAPAVAAPMVQSAPSAATMVQPPQPPRPLTPSAPPAAVAPAAPAPAIPPPPVAAQRPPLVAPAQSAASTEAAYRQALAQSEAASQPPVVVSSQQAATPTLGMTLPRSRQVYDPRALATIPFVGGSTKLSNADLQTLREVAEIHQRRGGMLRVVGHARLEGAGNAANQQVTNFRVSGDRADAVAQALVRLGVNGAMIEVAAQGDGEPATTAHGQPDSAASRRVEIYLDN